jgi:hypothetical protein
MEVLKGEREQRKISIVTDKAIQKRPESYVAECE